MMVGTWDGGIRLSLCRHYSLGCSVEYFVEHESYVYINNYVADYA